VFCVRVWLAVQQVAREPPGCAVFAGTADMVDRAARASPADMVAARMAAMNIPGMMAIAMGIVLAPGMQAASVEYCPYGFPLSYLNIFARIR
jgi:hypothetical protein